MPLRPCLEPHCPTLTARTRCPAHTRQHDRTRRPNTTARGLGSDHQRLVRQALERDGHRCQVRLPGCTGHATTGDHVIPRSRGGRNTLDNYASACAHCNASKGNR